MEVNARIDLRQLRLTPPPARVHVKCMRAGMGWTVLARADAPHRVAVAQWLAGWAPTNLDLGRADACVLRAWFARAPRPFDAAGGVTVTDVIAEPEGDATVLVAGPRRAVGEFLSSRDAHEPPPRIEQVKQAASAAGMLTMRQREVLLDAHAAGYYEVPRRITLTRLAEKLDATPSAIGECLRRAEGRIVDHIVAELLVAREHP